MPRTKETVRIRLDNGKIIHRVVKHVQFGNFDMKIVTFEGKDYLVGEGDEYLRDGGDQVFKLGKELDK
jgi:hypothetical protein